MAKTFSIFAVSTAMAPVTHMSGSRGNEAMVNTELVESPEGVMREVPVLSGCAIRHRCVRRPGARFLIERWGLEGELTRRQLNYFFHGGARSESGGREDAGRIAACNQLFPLNRLVGGCLPDQIMSGSLKVWRGTLVCRENVRLLPDVCPAGWWDGRGPNPRPAEGWATRYQYTRGDAARSTPDLMPAGNSAADDGEDSDAQMIYGGSAVAKGAVFVHGFLAAHVSDMELAALLLSLRLWHAEGGTIGGMSGRGHGRLKTCLAGDLPDPAAEEELLAGYVDYVDAVRDEAVAWLRAALPSGLRAGKNGRNGKAVAGATA